MPTRDVLIGSPIDSSKRCRLLGLMIPTEAPSRTAVKVRGNSCAVIRWFLALSASYVARLLPKGSGSFSQPNVVSDQHDSEVRKIPSAVQWKCGMMGKSF